MIVDDFDFICVPCLPSKANSPLHVDRDSPAADGDNVFAQLLWCLIQQTGEIAGFVHEGEDDDSRCAYAIDEAMTGDR